MMQDSSTGGKKPIEQVRELRARRTKLEHAGSDISERTKAEEKLRQSEQRFRSIFDNANDIIGFVNTTGKIIEVNKKVAHILGYEPDELVGKNFMNCGILPTKNAPTIIRLFKELVERRGLWDVDGDGHNVIQLALNHKKGHTVLVEASTTAIETDGKLEGFLSVLRDITERKTAEQTLRESEEKYRGVFELAPDGILTVDLKGMVTSCNTALLERSGYSKDDFVGRHISEIPTARLRDIPKYIKMFSSLLSGNVPEPFESEWIHKDGTKHWSEARVGVLKRHGKTMGFQVVTRDITDRKRAREALKESEEKYRSLVELANDGIAIIQSLELRYVNPRLAEMLGYSVDEMIASKATDYVRPDELTKLVGIHQKRMAGQDVPQVYETVLVTKDGRSVNVEVNAGTINYQGERAVLVMYRDITERKLAEERIEFLAKVLSSSPVSVIATDKGGKVIYVNPATERLFGYTSDELLGRNPIILNADPNADKIQGDIFGTTGQGRVWRGGILNKKKNGEVFPIYASVYQLLDEEGNFIALVGFQEDITERKKAEDALRESEEKFRNLAELSPNMIFINQSGKVVYVNNKCVEIMGYRKEEFYSPDFDFLSLVTPEYRDLVDKTYVEHANGRGTTPVEYALITKAGERIEVLHTSALITYRGETAILGTDIDITERKRAEEALRESQRQKQAILDSIPDIAWLKDKEGRYLAANEPLCKAFGVKLEDLVGKTDFDISPADLAKRYRTDDEKVMKSDKRKRVEEPWGKKKGKRIWIETIKTPIHNDKGEVVGTSGIARDITERKRAEEKIEAERKKLETYIEAMVDGVSVTDANGVLIQVNKALAKIHNCSPQEMVGKRFIEFVAKRDIPKAQNIFVESIKKKKHVIKNLEITGLRKDGSEFSAMLNIRNLWDKEGKLASVISVVRDITERKKAEEALRESEEKLRNVVERASDGIAILQDGVLKYVNPRTAEITGYTVEEMTNTPFARYVHPDELPKVADVYERRMAGEEIGSTYETMVRRKDGSDVHIEVSGGLITYKGKPADLAFARDITERKKASDALSSALAWQEAVFEGSRDAVFISDADSRFVMVNRAACELTGYSRDELLGMRIPDLHEEEDLVAYNTYHDRIMDGEEIVSEAKILRKDGTKVDTEFNNRCIEISGTACMHTVARDITERKYSEQRLLQEQAKLKSLASQLTLAEEHERHRIAAELHDRIGQSLAIAKMNLEALRESEYGKKTDETLDEICNLLAQTIADTRTLTFDLSSPVLYELGFETAVAEWLTEQIQDNHGIATQFEDDGRPKPLDDDIRILLFRNVRELLINVVKHARAHKVKVSIRRAGRQISVSVEDDGVGFDPALVAPTAAKRPEFGLFSIRQRLEELGGHLEIDSEPGLGCMVTMTAPLKQD